MFHAFSDELSRLTQIVPVSVACSALRAAAHMKSTFDQPQQRKLVDDTQRRLNVLFDELNCETVPEPVVAQLNEMVKGESGIKRYPLVVLKLIALRPVLSHCGSGRTGGSCHACRHGKRSALPDDSVRSNA